MSEYILAQEAAKTGDDAGSTAWKPTSLSDFWRALELGLAPFVRCIPSRPLDHDEQHCKRQCPILLQRIGS
jgi:hypothetical protein